MGITFIIFKILAFGAIILTLVSFLSGVIGLMRAIIRKGKFSGIGTTVTGIFLSFAFWLFIVPGLAVAVSRFSVKQENKVHVSVSHLRELWRSFQNTAVVMMAGIQLLINGVIYWSLIIQK